MLRQRIRDWLSSKQALAGFAAGGIVGLLVLGIGGRFVMSALALAMGVPLGWSFGGSMQVIILGWALGPPAGLLYVALDQWLPSSRVLGGLVFGVVFCLLLVAVYFLRPAGPVELTAAPILGGFLFGGLVVASGVALATTTGWIARLGTPSRQYSPLTGTLVGLTTVLCAALAFWALVSR